MRCHVSKYLQIEWSKQPARVHRVCKKTHRGYFQRTSLAAATSPRRVVCNASSFLRRSPSRCLSRSTPSSTSSLWTPQKYKKKSREVYSVVYSPVESAAAEQRVVAPPFCRVRVARIRVVHACPLLLFFIRRFRSAPSRLAPPRRTLPCPVLPYLTNINIHNEQG